MKIAIGCDHGAFDMKLLIMEHLKEQGHELVDFGSYDKNSIDYPAIGRATAVQAQGLQGCIMMQTYWLSAAV